MLFFVLYNPIIRILKTNFRPSLIGHVHTHTHSLVVHRVVGGVGSLRLPPWGGGHGACLMDYVPLVHKLLNERVDYIIQSYVRRKEYVAALLSMMGRSVVEYDTEGFKKVAFLFEQQGFAFVALCEFSHTV